MNNTEEKKNHPLHLISDSTISTQILNIKTLCNKGRDFLVQITEHKKSSPLPFDNAMLLMELWNEYHNLPLDYKFSPKVLFQSMQVNDKLLESKNKAIKKLESEIELNIAGFGSTIWWNKVYRWSLLVILMGLIAFALGK